MIQEKSIESLQTFLASAKENFCTFVDSVDLEACKQAAELIIASQANGNRIMLQVSVSQHMSQHTWHLSFLLQVTQLLSFMELRQYMDHADSLSLETW